MVEWILAMGIRTDVALLGATTLYCGTTTTLLRGAAFWRFGVGLRHPLLSSGTKLSPPLWLVLPYHWHIVIEVFRAGWDRPLVPDSDLVVSNLLVWLDPDVI
jgi:hypothetical protein